MKRAVVILAAALATVALSACETPTPYQPVVHGTLQWGGYSETKIEANRWRVTFQGNTATPRQTVQDDLLYRAAELTLAQGFDWFETTDRATAQHTETYVDPGPWGYGYGWRPYWRFYGRGGWGGRRGGPWGDPFFNEWPADVETYDRFETSAEIVMNHGPKPANDAAAFDARDVVANLSSHIIRPK